MFYVLRSTLDWCSLQCLLSVALPPHSLTLWFSDLCTQSIKYWSTCNCRIELHCCRWTSRSIFSMILHIVAIYKASQHYEPPWKVTSNYHFTSTSAFRNMHSTDYLFYPLIKQNTCARSLTWKLPLLNSLSGDVTPSNAELNQFVELVHSTGCERLATFFKGFLGGFLILDQFPYVSTYKDSSNILPASSAGNLLQEPLHPFPSMTVSCVSATQQS